MGRLPLTPVVVLALATSATVGCASTLKPIYPTSTADVVGPTGKVRFAADQISFHEPGVPIATGNIWKHEVASYTAERMNELLETPEDAPVARTRVTLEMHGPSAFQVGSWKEMTVALTSQLPDGRVVRTEPQSAYIDNNLEYIAQQVLLFGGPIFEVAAFVLGIYMFTTGFANFSNPLFCGCVIALAFSGLFLNVAQAVMQWVIALLEERRASDLYQEALVAHAEDVKEALLKPAPTPPSGPRPGEAPPVEAPSLDEAPPAPPAEPAPSLPETPPPLDDPADTEPEPLDDDTGPGEPAPPPPPDGETALRY